MSNIAHDMMDAKVRFMDTKRDAKREANAQIEGLKSKAANALASPYVRGGVALGVAAAGYAFFNRKKSQPHAALPAPKEKPGDIVKVGSLLLSLVASAIVAPNAPRVEVDVDVKPRIETQPLPVLPAKTTAAAKDTQDATGNAAAIKNLSSSWLGRQWQIIKAAATAWMDDFAPSMGAALSYYTLFSLAPLLVIVIAIAGLVFGRDAAQGAIIAQLGGIMGEQGATAVQGLLQAAREPSTGIVASIIGGLLLLLGATAIFAELQSDLDRIWRAPAKKNQSGLWSWLRSRVLSFGLILGLAFMLMVSLVVSAALAATGSWLGGGSEAESIIASVLNFAASLAIFTVLFAMIYKIMPNVKISWHDVWMGAGVTALLFTIGKSLIGIYLAKSNVASGFGAAGSFVILVAWFYYSAQIFLFGAEYTWVYANNKVKGQ